MGVGSQRGVHRGCYTYESIRGPCRTGQAVLKILEHGQRTSERAAFRGARDQNQRRRRKANYQFGHAQDVVSRSHLVVVGIH